VSTTDKAAAQIANLMQKTAIKACVSNKVVAKCGMEYTMDYVTEVDPLDGVVDQDGARAMVAPGANVLFGTEIDYETLLE
jgi:iron-sulfur cluster assembly protein